MGSVGAEHELYDCVVAWLWPEKSALLCSRCCIPDHDRVAIPAGRKPLAVRTERKRAKTPTVDCRKHLVRRARPWRDLGRLDFFCWHRKLANSWRCLLRGLLCKRGMSTERQRKTEKCKNFYDSIPHRFDPDDAASVQKRYQPALSLSTRSFGPCEGLESDTAWAIRRWNHRWQGGAIEQV